MGIKTFYSFFVMVNMGNVHRLSDRSKVKNPSAPMEPKLNPHGHLGAKIPITKSRITTRKRSSAEVLNKGRTLHSTQGPTLVFSRRIGCHSGDFRAVFNHSIQPGSERVRTWQVRKARFCEALTTPLFRGQLQPSGIIFAEEKSIARGLSRGSTIPLVAQWTTGEDATTVNMRLLILFVQSDENLATNC